MKTIKILCLLTTIGIAVLALCSIDSSESMAQSSSASAIWTSAASWYSPPPASVVSASGVTVPPELLIGVPVSLRKSATKLLGTSNIVELSEEQESDLSVGAKPDLILSKLIEARSEKLRFFKERPVDEAQFKRYGQSEVESQQQMRATIMAVLSLDLKKYQRWHHKLKPYLVRAVALNEGTGSFSAKLTSQGLIIAHGSLGSQPAPMINVPVRAFLPSKPQGVFTTVDMAQ